MIERTIPRDINWPAEFQLPKIIYGFATANISFIHYFVYPIMYGHIRFMASDGSMSASNRTAVDDSLQMFSVLGESVVVL